MSGAATQPEREELFQFPYGAQSEYPFPPGQAPTSERNLRRWVKLNGGAWPGDLDAELFDAACASAKLQPATYLHITLDPPGNVWLLSSPARWGRKP